MALKNFIPEFWASVVLDMAQKAMVYGQTGVCNRNYEGQFAQAGDTVHITGIGDVTINDYTDESDMADPDMPADADTLLTISQDKSFSFYVPDKGRKQAAGDFVNPYMRRAAYRMADKVDQFVASLYGDTSSANNIGSTATPKVPNLTTGDAQNIFNLIQDCATALTNANVPRDGRFMIAPPWFTGLIVKDYHKEGASAPGASEQAQLTGQVARIAGFAILESNNVPIVSSTKYKILFGTNDATTYADDLQKVESIRHPKRFGDIVRGRHLFGAKLAQPEYAGVLTVSQT